MGMDYKITSKKVIIGLIGLSLAVTVALLLIKKWEGWVTYTIDSAGLYYTGNCNSLAIDANDRVHISYLSRDNYVMKLKYATNTSGSWVTSTIEDLKVSPSSRSLTAIAIDSNGKEHIGYSDNSIIGGTGVGIPVVKYATNVTGVWGSNFIDSQIYTYDIPIAIDSYDKVHMCYISHSLASPWNFILKYATNVSGAWYVSDIDYLAEQTITSAHYTSLAIDSADKVHICYFEPSNNYSKGVLKYATNASGKWVKSVIDSTGIVGRYNSIAIDSNNKVHISYWDETNDALKYATNSPGSWVPFVIDNIGCSPGYCQYGGCTSIAIDSKNMVHISYSDDKNDTLKYATNASGKWVTYGMAKLGTSWHYNSIAIDSHDTVHISYFDESKGGAAELKYIYYSTSPLKLFP